MVTDGRPRDGAPRPVPGFRTQSRDTSFEAERLLFEHYRGLTPGEKLAVVGELCRAAEELALAGARLTHPAASEAELRLRAAMARLGPDVMRAAFGWSPPGSGRP